MESNKLYKVVHIIPYEVTTCKGLKKVLHDFEDVFFADTLDECINYFLTSSDVDIKHCYRILKMSKRKSFTFNVSLWKFLDNRVLKLSKSELYECS